MKIFHTNIILHTNVKTCEAGLPTPMILWLEHLIAYSFCIGISPRGEKQSYSKIVKRKRAGSSIAQRQRRVHSRESDLSVQNLWSGASTHALNLAPFFFLLKKSLIRLLRNSLSKYIVLIFSIHEAKRTSSLQVKPISTCRWNCSHALFLSLDALGTLQCSGSEEQASICSTPACKETSVTLFPKKFGFFKCLEVTSSGTHSWATGEQSSRYPALCNVTSCNGTVFLNKDHRIKWRDTYHRGLWDRNNTVAPLEQQWWALVWLEDEGRQLRKKQSGNIYNFSVSLTRWDMLATLLLQ